MDYYDGRTYLIKTLDQLIKDGANHRSSYVEFGGHALQNSMMSMLGQTIEIKLEGNHYYGMYIVGTSHRLARTRDIEGFLKGVCN